VRPEAIKLICDAARWAPSSNNSQPLDIVVISEEDEKIPLAELYVTAYRNEADDLLFRDDAEELFEDPFKVKKRILGMEDMLRHQLLDPPYILVVCANPKKSRSYLVEAGAAIQNILLTAWDLNLGSCCIEVATTVLSEYFDTKKVKWLLDIPEHIEVIALIPIGKIEAVPPKPERRLLKEFHHAEFW
jgi:nitroreductase